MDGKVLFQLYGLGRQAIGIAKQAEAQRRANQAIMDELHRQGYRPS